MKKSTHIGSVRSFNTAGTEVGSYRQLIIVPGAVKEPINCSKMKSEGNHGTVMESLADRQPEKLPGESRCMIDWDLVAMKSKNFMKRLITILKGDLLKKISGVPVVYSIKLRKGEFRG